MKKLLTLLMVFFGLFVFAQKRDYNIGVLLDNRTEKIHPLLETMQNQIISVVGEDANIIFSEDNVLVNNYSLVKAEKNYNTLINNNTDIILAFGLINNEIVSKQSSHKKPTILFGALNRDFSTIDFSKATSGVKNFTYLIESESFQEDFIKFKALTNFKKLGILIENHMVDLLPLKETFDREFKMLDAEYELIPYETVSDITSNLNNIDAVYLASGFFLKDEEVKLLAKTFISRGLPSFTSNGIEQVEQGFMGTNQSGGNIRQFIRRIALSVEGYVNGVPLSDMPVFIEFSEGLTINYNTAELLGVPIKYSLIATTNFVGDYNNITSKRKYTLLDVINETVSNNLSLQSEKKAVEMKTQDVKDAKSNYYPEITASATGSYLDPKLAEISGGQNPEYKTSGNIKLTQTLFSEAANANITIQENLQKAEQENYNAAELDAILNASTAYFNALILKANTKIQSQNLEVTKRNLEIAQQNYEAGQSGKMDVLRFKSEQAQNTQTFVEAINQLERSLFTLNSILNNEIDFKLDVDDAELSKGIFENYNYKQIGELIDDPSLRKDFVAFLVKEAKTNAPELASLNYNLKATERTLKLNSSGRFVPTLALQGQYNRDFNQWGKGSVPVPVLDDNYNIGLNLSLPIFQQNKQNINKQIATIQQEQLNINKDNIELNIERSINEAILQIINEITNIELSKISEETAEETLDLVQSSYSNGAVPITQLLESQRNYLQAQLSKANATYKYLLSFMELERYLGRYFLLNTEAQNQDFIQRFNAFLLNQN